MMKLLTILLENLKLIPWLLTSALILLLWGIASVSYDAGESLEAWAFRRKKALSN